MKGKASKLLSILLALVMVAGMLPSGTLAEGNQKVTSVAITYDPAKVVVSTKLTGKQVTDALVAATETGAGEQTIVDKDYVYLAKKDGTGYMSLRNSTNLLSAADEYFLYFNVEEKSGYEWDTEALPSVTVNGTAVSSERVEWYDKSPTGSINVHFPVSISNADVVLSVSVSAPVTTAAKGDTVQFTAQVQGSVETVIWSLSGNSNSSIDNTGKLTVGSAETAESLTVRATSTLDSTKYGEATIQIAKTALSIVSVTVSPATATVYKGGSQSFSANVTQTGGADTSVTWSVSGAISADTTINESGRLWVSNDETAATLTVRATSNYDSSKYGEATVTVQARLKVTQVAIVYDASQVTLSTSVTGKQVTQALVAATETSAGEQAIVDKGYVYLAKKAGTGYMSLRNSEELLSATDEYFLYFNVEEKSGYEWDTEALPSVTVNGTAVSPERVEWYSESPDGSIDVYFPVSLGGSAPTKTITSVTITGVTAPVVGATSTTSGITVTPSPDGSLEAIPSSSIFWRVKNGGSWEDFSGNFEAGKEYAITVSIESKPGYSFAGAFSFTATVNGDNGTEISSPNDVRRNIIYSFGTLSGGTPTEITEIRIAGVTVPMAGASPVTTGLSTVPTDAGYTISAYWWDNTDDKPIYASAQFEAGHEYLIGVKCMPKDGYQFSSGTITTALDGPAAEAMTSSKIGGNVLPNGKEAQFFFQVPAVTPTCTVTFDANGGSVTPASGTTGADGRLASLPTPTRSGSYSFDGWYTEAKGGTEVTTDTVFTENTTIYAHWTYMGSGLITEDGELLEVGKILRSEGWSRTVGGTNEPTHYGYDPDNISMTLRFAGVGSEAEALTVLEDAKFERAARNGEFETLTLAKGGSSPEDERILSYTKENGETVPVMHIRAYDDGGVHIELTSLAPGAVRIMLDGREYLVVTPGDVNLDGEIDANDWANIMRWTLEAPSRYDTKPDDLHYTVKINGKDCNLWILLADIDGKSISNSADEAQWRDIVDSNDWRILMYLALEAWKK